jgi:hypothetical protein
MEGVGQTVFVGAIAAAAVAAIAYVSGLVWMVVVASRHHGARRPMWLNYAALALGLAVPTMVVGLVLWGRLDWWFLLLFAPFVAARFILFRMGSSISRRNRASHDGT